MTFKEWYKAYNPEINMDFDMSLDELLSCWYAAFEEGYERGRRDKALEELARIGQSFDRDDNPPVGMSKVSDKDYKC